MHQGSSLRNFLRLYYQRGWQIHLKIPFFSQGHDDWTRRYSVLKYQDSERRQQRAGHLGRVAVPVPCLSMLNTYGAGAGVRLILTGLIIITVILLASRRDAGGR